MKMARERAFTMALRPGSLVRCRVETFVVHKGSYYIINKHSGGHIWVDNIQGVFWPDTFFELDDYCNKHNNPPTREEVKMSKQQAVKNDQAA